MSFSGISAIYGVNLNEKNSVESKARLNSKFSVF